MKYYIELGEKDKSGKEKQRTGREKNPLGETEEVKAEETDGREEICLIFEQTDFCNLISNKLHLKLTFCPHSRSVAKNGGIGVIMTV